MNLIIWTIFNFCFVAGYSYADPGPDAILGHWMSTRRNVIVQVYKEGKEFKGKVTWFKDTDDPSKPMATRTDEHNPNPKLRQRKVLGMQVLSRLTYDTKSRRWVEGKFMMLKREEPGVRLRTWTRRAY